MSYFQIPFIEWFGVSTDYAWQLGTEPSGLPLYIRTFFLAASKTNGIGHAEFAPDQLCKLLRSPDGEGWSIPSSQQVSNAIMRGKDVGLLSGDSGLRCVVVPADFVSRGRAGMTCKTHNRGRPRQ